MGPPVTPREKVGIAKRIFRIPVDFRRSVVSYISRSPTFRFLYGIISKDVCTTIPTAYRN